MIATLRLAHSFCTWRGLNRTIRDVLPEYSDVSSMLAHKTLIKRLFSAHQGPDIAR